MNTATLAANTARCHFTLPAGLMALLQRAMASAAPATPVARVLDQDATTWVTHPLGRKVICETGTLWLTFDNETQDVILEAGQSHRCTKASTLAIHALAAARITVA